MSEEQNDKYYIMKVYNPDRMLLASMPPLPKRMKDGWRFGQTFTVEPEQPIKVSITDGYEDKELVSFFNNPPVVSQQFFDALVEAGVDNLIAYDVIIQSKDGSISIEGYKAINIIGLVKAAGPGTVYVGDSRLIDAGIDGLEIEPQSIKGLLMFRLAEDTSAIVVHEKVKRHLESKGFHSLVFTEPGDYFSLGV